MEAIRYQEAIRTADAASLSLITKCQHAPPSGCRLVFTTIVSAASELRSSESLLISAPQTSPRWQYEIFRVKFPDQTQVIIPSVAEHNEPKLQLYASPCYKKKISPLSCFFDWRARLSGRGSTRDPRQSIRSRLVHPALSGPSILTFHLSLRRTSLSFKRPMSDYAQERSFSKLVGAL